MTTQIRPKDRPGIDWCIRDLKRQAKLHRAQAAAMSTIGQQWAHEERAALLEALARHWKDLL